MDHITAFGILEIEKTTNEDDIKSAYRSKLSDNNPEENPEGFKLLREAYETALSYREEEETEEQEESIEPENELLNTLTYIYSSMQRRLSEVNWLRIINMDIFKDLECGEEAKWQLFDFLSENYRIPFNIYRMLDSKFEIVNDKETFKDHLSPEFVEYMIQCIEDTDDSQEFSYYYFEGNDEGPFDRFCDTVYELEQTVYEPGVTRDRLDGLKDKIAFMDNCGLKHPVYDCVKARYLALTDKSEEALEIANNLLIQPICMESVKYRAYAAVTLFIAGNVEHARKLFDILLEKQDDLYEVHHYMAEYYADCNELPVAIEQARDAAEILKTPYTLNFLKTLCKQYTDKYKDRMIGSLSNGTCCALCYAYLDLNMEAKALEILIDRSELKTVIDGYDRLLCICYIKMEKTSDALVIARRYKNELETKQGEEDAEYIKEELVWCEDTINKLQVQILIDKKEYDEAYECCKTLLDKMPGDYHALLCMQKASFYTGRDKDVIELMTKLNNICPDAAPGYEYGVRVLFDYHQFFEVSQVLKDAERHEVKSFCLNEVMPTLMEYAKDGDMGVLDQFLKPYDELFERAREKMDPSLIKRELKDKCEMVAEVYYYKGMGTEDADERMELLTQAININPRKKYYLDHDLCAAWKETIAKPADGEKVAEHIAEAIAEASDNYFAYKAIALMCEKIADESGEITYYEKANEYRKKVVEINKQELAESSFYVGRNYMQMSMWAEAEENFDICYEASHNHTARRFQTKALAKLGEFDRALEYIRDLEEEIELDKSDPKYEIELEEFIKIIIDHGILLEHQGLYHQAKRLYEDLINTEDIPDSRKYIAVRRCINIYLYEKKYDKAKEILSLASSVFPTTDYEYEKARILRISAKTGAELEDTGKYIEKLLDEYNPENSLEITKTDLEELLGDLLIYNIGDSYSGCILKKNTLDESKKNNEKLTVKMYMEMASLYYEAGDTANMVRNLCDAIDCMKDHFKFTKTDLSYGEQYVDEIIDRYLSLPFNVLGRMCIAVKYYCYVGRLKRAKDIIDRMEEPGVCSDYSEYEADCKKKEVFAIYCECAHDKTMARILFKDVEKQYGMSNIASLKARDFVVRFER